MNRWTSVFLFSALSIAACSPALGQREVGHVFPVILKDALDPTQTTESDAEKTNLVEAKFASTKPKASPLRQEAENSKEKVPAKPSDTDKASRPDESNDRVKNSKRKTDSTIKSMLQPISESDQSQSVIKPQVPDQLSGNVYKSPRVMPPTMSRLPSPMVSRKIQSNSTGFNLNDSTAAQQSRIQIPAQRSQMQTPEQRSQMQKGIRVANRHVADPPAGTFMNFRSSEPVAPPSPIPSRPTTVRLTDEVPTSNLNRPLREVPTLNIQRPLPTPTANPGPKTSRPAINFSDDSLSKQVRPGTSILERPTKVAATKVAANKVVLQSKIIGPESLIADQPDEFEVMITNSSDHPATNVIIRLSVPSEITITNLDRDALLDHKSRSVSWKVKKIPPGQSEWIRYQAISSSPGSHPQILTLGMNNTFQGKTPFTTQVQPRTESAARVADAVSNTRR